MKVNKKAMIFGGIVGFLTGFLISCNQTSIEAGNGFIGEEVGSLDSSTNVSGRIGVYKFEVDNRDYIVVESDKGISVVKGRK